jgi:hypothetical protein
MECEFCKKILQNKYSLVSHQTKTKYCLKLQGFQLLKNLTYKDIHQVKFLFINIYKGIHFNFDLKTKTYI